MDPGGTAGASKHKLKDDETVKVIEDKRKHKHNAADTFKARVDRYFA